MKYGLSERLTPEIFHLSVSNRKFLANVGGGWLKIRKFAEGFARNWGLGWRWGFDI